MSDNESDDLDINEGVNDSMKNIHTMVEQIAHNAKHLYSRAISLDQQIQNPVAADVWAQTFKLHERARSWAKKNMVASKCSLWEINKTLTDSAKKDGRITIDGQVTLTKAEGEILDLSHETPVSIWKVLGRLPRFFI
jgi:uncharacterized protein YcbX